MVRDSEAFRATALRVCTADKRARSGYNQPPRARPAERSGAVYVGAKGPRGSQWRRTHRELSEHR